MIWVITAMLWHADLPTVSYSTYSKIDFNSKVECLDHIFWNKMELVTELVEVHALRDGKQLTTWAFFCETEKVEEV